MRVVGLVGGGLALENREESVFKQLADPSSADLYERVETSPSSTRLNNYLDGIVGSNASQITATIAADLAPQVKSLTSLSRLVETRVAAQAVAEANRSARADRWLAGIVGGVALALLIAAALLSVLITRSIARPLRRLTASADEVADVAQLELVRVADTDDPEAAVPHLRPVRVGTADELGELAQAFNRVQQIASNLVERQLVSRQNVATMFGNVGRRTQNLVGRQLAMIDSLERNEQDPALLDRLYRLDHVSTRLRRNANSLVVLSGATEQQITSEPLSVADTIRSALGEIEGFQRVRLGSVGDELLAPDRHRGRHPAARRAAGERHLVLAAAHRGRGRGAVERRRRRAGPDRRPRARHDAGAAGGGERPAGLPGAARPGAHRRARAVRGRAAGPAARDRRAAAADAGDRRDGRGTDPRGRRWSGRTGRRRRQRPHRLPRRPRLRRFR
jgi:HAMP domain-containing protein